MEAQGGRPRAMSMPVHFRSLVYIVARLACDDDYTVREEEGLGTGWRAVFAGTALFPMMTVKMII